MVCLPGGTPLRTVIGATRYRRTKAGTASDRARTPASQLLFRELSLAQAGHSANGTLRGIGLNSEIVQVLCKAAAPFAESGLFDIESLTLLTRCFDDDVHQWNGGRYLMPR